MIKATPPRCYLNGVFLALDEARISVMDRGFLFGDGVYEVIPVYGHRPFRLGPHLRRLDASLARIQLDDELNYDQWSGIVQRLINENAGEDLAIYLQVTRGPAPRRDHRFPERVTPTVFAMCHPLPAPDPSVRSVGIHACTVEDIRWAWCDIKAVTLLPNVLLREQARQEGADEALLLCDGQVTEGSASNVFIVRDGTLATPPKGELILPGITRDLVVELSPEAGVPCEERTITEAELRAADEIWVTSSTREIAPVTQLDRRPVGGGHPGPVHRRLCAVYDAYKEAVRNGTAL